MRPQEPTLRCADAPAPPADISITFQAAAAGASAGGGKQIAKDVEVTLEEIGSGCLKQVAFQRKRLIGGEMLIEDRTVVIDVAPGVSDGTTFVFEGHVPRAYACTALTRKRRHPACMPRWGR